MHFIKIPTTLYYMFLSSVAYYLYRINRLRLMSKPMLCKGIRSECNFSFYFVLVKNKKYKQKISVILIESYSLAKYFVRSLTGFRSNRLTHDFCREKARERERERGGERGGKKLAQVQFLCSCFNPFMCRGEREKEREREAAKKLQNKVETFASLAKIPKLAAEKERERRRGWRRGEWGSHKQKSGPKDTQSN